MTKQKICVVTGSRAEYGILHFLIKGLAEDQALELQLIATGMHLSPEFGLTFKQIEDDGFAIDAKIEMLLSSDTPVGIAKSVGLGIIGFADAFYQLKPDIVVVIGDRFEILAAAQAALIAGISIAHISGGEVTEGAIDDSIRHCISKMARYHFVAAEAYRRRVIQLGEQPEFVFNVGDPALDNIARLPLLSKEELSDAIGFDLCRQFFLVTFHPTTTGAFAPAQDIQALLDALDEFPEFGILITKSNADMGGRALNEAVDAYAKSCAPRVTVVTSLGQRNYLSAMRHCAAVVGNSSSGIVEAPAMGVATVNIGNRQQGRLMASSVINCLANRASVVQAIQKAISPDFGKVVAQTVSLYGNCDASMLILNKLKELAADQRNPKRFYDLP